MKLSKVVRLFNKQEQSQQELIVHIEQLLQAAKDGDVTNVLVAANCTDGTIVTGYCNLDIGERQYLVGHVQTDIAFAVVEANVDRLIEHI